MVSRLKCSSSRYGRQASTFFLGTLPRSICSLNPLSRSMNLSTLPIILVAAPHDLSLGLFISRMMITAVTSSTPLGGFFSDLASPRSFLFRVSSAASAASTSGSALSSSACTDTCFSPTALAITAHFSASTCAASFSMAADAFSLLTFSAKAPALDTFSSTSTAFTLACSTRMSTSFCVFISLSSPLLMRSMLVCVTSRFLLSSDLYSLMSSRNVLGVV
mmetsp:Transcript_14121/g.33937  ORF Transcript_14121/g.33937 Transcript_14121/m.33937 type:complete len:219 (+) Transcript_14121:1001-1657(+)